MVTPSVGKVFIVLRQLGSHCVHCGCVGCHYYLFWWRRASSEMSWGNKLFKILLSQYTFLSVVPCCVEQSLTTQLLKRKTYEKAWAKTCLSIMIESMFYLSFVFVSKQSKKFGPTSLTTSDKIYSGHVYIHSVYS